MEPTVHFRGVCDIDEPTIPFVQIENVRLSKEIVRKEDLIALWHFAVFDIVTDIEVEVSIRIVITPCDAGTETVVSDSACPGREAFEGAVAVIAIEDIRLIVRDVEVSIVVVIVIREGTSHSPTGITDTRSIGYIAKSAVAVVSIKRVLR